MLQLRTCGYDSCVTPKEQTQEHTDQIPIQSPELADSLELGCSSPLSDPHVLVSLELTQSF